MFWFTFDRVIVDRDNNSTLWEKRAEGESDVGFSEFAFIGK
jgi:hypothetical protein